MEDIGEAKYVLGVKIIRNHPKKLVGMCQEAYIKNVLERFMDTPIEKGRTLSLD